MIGYATLGTNDFDRSVAFYDGVAELLGVGRIMGSDRMMAWGTPGQPGMFCTCKPHDGNAASVGNGTMIGLSAPDQDTVHKVHAYALANGGSDEGAPGPRGGGFYGAYFRDPDGNKLAIFAMVAG